MCIERDSFESDETSEPIVAEQTETPAVDESATESVEGAEYVPTEADLAEMDAFFEFLDSLLGGLSDESAEVPDEESELIGV